MGVLFHEIHSSKTRHQTATENLLHLTVKDVMQENVIPGLQLSKEKKKKRGGWLPEELPEPVV